MIVCMETYSMDLRERVVRACDEQIGTRTEIAEMFGVSTAWIRRLLQRRRESGGFSAHRRGGRRFAAFDDAGQERLRGLVEAQPDATLQELLDRSGVQASIMAVHRALERLGCHRKQSRSGPPNRIVRTL
jgi:transposase